MNNIIDNINEIYRIVDKNKVHQAISNYFIPSLEERKNNAEISTPIILVEEILDKIPKEFWTKLHKVFEPCCGKGNFVIKIFEKFYNGLVLLYPNKFIRCEKIITECLYYADLTSINIFITTEILKCEIKNRTGLKNIDYLFNSSVGNTLELNILSKWDITKFNAVIGNPPYEDIPGGVKLYLKFTKYALNILDINGYLLYITPRNIIEYLLLDKKDLIIDYFYQIMFLSIGISNKYFKNVNSTFVYFLIEKIQYYKETIIEYLYNNETKKISILLEQGYKIPRVLNNIDINIIKKLTSKKNNYIFNNFVFENKNKKIILTEATEHSKIIIIDKINKTYKFPGRYYYCNKKDLVFNEDKLVLSIKGYLMPFVDRTKNYTYSPNFKYIIDDNLDEIKILFESNLINYLFFQFSKNGFDLVSILNFVDKKNLTNIKTNQDLYLLYNINNEEVTHIKSLLKKKFKN